MKNICLVGQVFVDVTLPTPENTVKLRAGGIMHAARTLWALDCPYTIAYCAPEYFDDGVQENARNYGTASTTKIGNVTGCPNVILVGDVFEAGPQGYEFLLRQRQHCELYLDELRHSIKDATDVLLFYGDFDLPSLLPVVGQSKAAVHFDANFEPHTPQAFDALGRPFDTIILSTSTPEFLGKYQGDITKACSSLLDKHCHLLLLKENRGGARLFRNGARTIQTPAQPRNVEHSVGVGDCFDAVFTALRGTKTDAAAMAFAACIAAEYACTTYLELFKERTQAWLAVPDHEMVDMAGTVLNWESRSPINVYIAAPDFDSVDRAPIDRAAEALRYHNFRPRLPIRENGQMGEKASVARRQSLCDADLQLIDECQLMLAVLLYDDPGTLIEIGIAAERGMPVIVYDPFGRADNLMLTQLPFLVSRKLDEVITAVFDRAAWVLKNVHS